MNDRKNISRMLKFLAWFCPEHLYEEIAGDLMQWYERDLKSVGKKRAVWRLLWNTIRFFRPGIIFRSKTSPRSGMFIYNFRFSVRHLLRQRLTTVLHLTGLTLGLSVCLLIAIFIRYELSFDTYHSDADRIYRVNSVWTDNPQKFHLYATPAVLAGELRATVPGLEKVTFARAHFASVVEVTPQKRFKEDRVLVVDPQYLDVFKIELIKGDGKAALAKPYHALLTESIAKKFYGDEDPVGRTFKYRNKFLITIAGVIRDLPSNTNLPASMLLSYVENDEFLDNGDIWHFGRLPWVKLTGMTFVVPAAGYDISDLQNQLTRLANDRINASPEMDKNIRGDFQIQPLHEIHFGSNDFGAGPWVGVVNPSWLWVFAGIGMIVLLLACINFLNLSTAQAIARGKEVGIRKSIGALRSQLIVQFLTEAAILTSLSGIASVIIISLVRSSINDLLGKQMEMSFSDLPVLCGFVLLSVFITSVLAGTYPAWIISRFNPSVTLRPSAQGVPRGTWLRKGLVTAQFTISTALILVVLVISRQVNFMRSTDLGFDKNNIVTVELPEHSKGHVFASEVARIRGVKEVSLTRSSPISNDHWWNGMSLTKGSPGKTVCAIYGDEHFFSLFGLKMLSGRIPVVTGQDQATKKVVVNEMLLSDLDLGSPSEAVGKHFWWGGDTEIVGVVADFNAEPLRYKICPTLIAQDTSVYDHLSIKLESAAAISSLTEIESKWKGFFSNAVYDFEFLHDEINGFYKTEAKLNTLFWIFAVLAILISCLGLWGLVTFVSQRRTKEIGIRKVLGASVAIIVKLISKEFVVIVLVAFAIGAPLSYYIVKLLLDNFAYKATVGFDLYIATGLIILGVAIVTVSFQTIKAAVSNPINSLRSE